MNPWKQATGDVEAYRRKLVEAYHVDPEQVAYIPGQKPLDEDERRVFFEEYWRAYGSDAPNPVLCAMTDRMRATYRVAQAIEGKAFASAFRVSDESLGGKV